MLLSRHPRALCSIPLRFVSHINLKYYDGSEAQSKYCKAQLEKMTSMMKKLNEERFFQYEKKEAKYDPKTGRIEIINIDMQKPKTIIKNFDDLQKEKAKLHQEFKLTTEDVEKSSTEELAQGYAKLLERTNEGYEVDKSDFYANTWDYMRIDWGIIVMRPPIFMYFPKIDRDFQLYREKIMNEYFLDMRKYYEDFVNEASVLDSIYLNNSYMSKSNLDNHPSHEIKAEDGTTKKYCGSTKNWRFVDPNVTDHHSLHYAAQSRVYLLLKNKYTGEWEFPTRPVFGNESFIKARRSLFTTISDDKWLIKHAFRNPYVATIRPFTEAEKKDKKNSYLSGVRTFYFNAFHLRGLPEFNFEKSDWWDYSWVPKANMNKFLTKERFDIFQHCFNHR